MRKKYLVPILLAVAMAACATTAKAPLTETQKVYSTYGRSLEVAVTVYSDSLKAAGEAAARGAITEDQLASVRAVGVKAEAALRTAKVALDAYLRSQTSTAGADVAAKFAAAQSVIAELTRALIKEGVVK